MITIEEREERRKTIGASEVYKLFDFDTEQAQNLWELKVGIIDYVEIDNDSIDAGNILEEEGLNFYAKSNNVELLINERIPYSKNKNIVSSLDAREEKTSIPVENKIIKESTWESWKVKRGGNCEYEGEKISVPKSYYLQVQTQIMCCDTEIGKLNVNTLTEDEVENPMNVEINDLHNKQITFFRNEEVVQEIEKRCEYMLWCMKYKKRPSELEYTEKYIFKEEI